MRTTFREIRLENYIASPVFHKDRAAWPFQPDVVVEIVAAAVCSADLRELKRSRRSPSIFGHEVVGRIVEAGPLSAVQIGALVSLNPNVTGIRRSSGFGDLMLVGGPPPKVAEALPLRDPRLGVHSSALVEPVACAIHAARRLRLCSPALFQSVCVVGAGVFGCLIAAVVGRSGVKVTLTNRSSQRLQFAARVTGLPASQLLPLQEIPSASYDAVVLATEKIEPSLLDTAYRAVKNNGLILLFGGTDVSISIDAVRRQELVVPMEAFGRQISLAGSYGADSQDFTEANAFLLDFRSEPLIHLFTRELTLDDLPAYLARPSPEIGKAFVHIGHLL